jgi:single-strand DNA-binding protein
MYSLNRAQIIGHLTEKPEVRQTPSGQMVGDLNVMMKQSFTNASGQTQVGTSFISATVWRGLAEISDKYLKKGSQVYLSGRLQTDEWQDAQSGQKRFKTRLSVDEMILLDPKVATAAPQGTIVAGGLNQVEVIGNATKDPELRQTPNGASVCNFGIATNFSWKSRTGETQEKTEFHNIVAWGPLAQALSETIKKGKKVYIAGRLQTRSWETPDGQKRWTTEIVADRGLLLGAYDPELGAPDASGTKVTLSEPTIKGSDSVVIPENPVEVPAINYESEIKPEDLPF